MKTMDYDGTTIVVVDCYDHHGRLASRERFILADGEARRITIGRSLRADITIDDAYAAPLHAAIEVTPDGQAQLTDLGSVNGIVVGGTRRRGSEPIEVADQPVVVGRTEVRIRTCSEALAPEKHDHRYASRMFGAPGLLAALGAFGFVAQTVYTTWLDAPLDLVGASVTAIAVSALGFVVWIALWALLSRIMRGQWRWLVHTAIAVGLITAYMFASDLYSLAWYMLSFRGGWLLETAIATAMLAILIYFHLRSASHAGPGRAAVFSALVPAVLVLGGYWMWARAEAKNVNAMDAAIRIYPPAYRLMPAADLPAYFGGLETLRSEATAKRDALPPSDGAATEETEEIEATD